MSGSIPFIEADAVHAALDWQALIDALRATFRAGGNTPLAFAGGPLKPEPVVPPGDCVRRAVRLRPGRGDIIHVVFAVSVNHTTWKLPCLPHCPIPSAPAERSRWEASR